tara:strand:+ start:10047 stop:10841 length:795 start_codon:yes stop_codon:yes gene_type:complete
MNPLPFLLRTGDNMAEININKKQLLKFITSFGKDIEDMTIELNSNNSITVEIAFISHYIRKVLSIDGNVVKAGAIEISDLPKVIQFIKATKTETIGLKQTASGKTLYVTAGSSKLQLPSSNTIVSHSKVSMLRTLIDKAEESKWTMFHKSKLSVTGTINLEDLDIVSKMRTVLDSNPVFKIIAHAGENEFSITTGKKHGVKLFTTTELKDADGPNVSIESTFGGWLMETIGVLDDEDATIHFGDSTVLVIKQHQNMLIVIDQRA